MLLNSVSSGNGNNRQYFTPSLLIIIPTVATILSFDARIFTDFFMVEMSSFFTTFEFKI